MPRIDTTTDLEIVAIEKGKEVYVFLFDDAGRQDTLRQIGRFASNPDLSFTWYDAAVASSKIRRVGE